MTGPPDASEARIAGPDQSASQRSSRQITPAYKWDYDLAARVAYLRRVAEAHTACPHGCCTSVDRVASDRLRSVSPLAEFVSRRVEVLG